MCRNYKKELSVFLDGSFVEMKSDLLQAMSADFNHKLSTESRKNLLKRMGDAIEALEINTSEGKKALIDALIAYEQRMGPVEEVVNKQVSRAKAAATEGQSRFAKAGFDISLLKKSLSACIEAYKNRISEKLISPSTSAAAKESLCAASTELKNLQITLQALDLNNREDCKKVVQLALYFCEQSYAGEKGTRAIFLASTADTNKEECHRLLQKIEPYEADYVKSILYKPPTSFHPSIFKAVPAEPEEDGPPERQNTGTPPSN